MCVLSKIRLKCLIKKNITSIKKQVFPPENLLFNNLLLIKAEDTEYLSHDRAVIYDNRVHCIVFRLQSDMTVFFIESLDRSGIINHSDYQITIMRRIACFYKIWSPLKIPTLIMESPFTFKIKEVPEGTTSAGIGK